MLRTWAVAAERINLSLVKIGDTPVTAEGLLRVVLIILLGGLASYWFRRVLIRICKRREGISQSALYAIARLSH